MSLTPHSKTLFLFGFHIDELVSRYGVMIYAIMFLIIFCETGLVITPVLPGDSMIFAAATISAKGNNVLNVHLIVLFMTLAAFSGDTVNYFIGNSVGPKIYKKKYKLISRNRLNRTKDYFKRYGTRTIIYARYIPVIRTFAPFIAGISEMKYKQFMVFNLIGGFSWVAIYGYGGYFLGNIYFVKKHFEITVIIVLFITLLPAAYGLLESKFWKKKTR